MSVVSLMALQIAGFIPYWVNVKIRENQVLGILMHKSSSSLEIVEET